jgi:hypothetical protein
MSEVPPCIEGLTKHKHAGSSVLGYGATCTHSPFGGWGSGFRVHGVGIRDERLGFRVKSSGVRVEELKVED